MIAMDSAMKDGRAVEELLEVASQVVVPQEQDHVQAHVHGVHVTHLLNPVTV